MSVLFPFSFRGSRNRVACLVILLGHDLDKLVDLCRPLGPGQGSNSGDMLQSVVVFIFFLSFLAATAIPANSHKRRANVVGSCGCRTIISHKNVQGHASEEENRLPRSEGCRRLSPWRMSPQVTQLSPPQSLKLRSHSKPCNYVARKLEFDIACHHVEGVLWMLWILTESENMTVAGSRLVSRCAEST